MNEPGRIEREILERIAAARIRLRFDKVVLRLIGGLKEALSDMVPEGEAVLFTVSAPIMRPAKLAAVLGSMVRAGMPDHEVRQVIEGNDVRVRTVTNVPARMPKVMGFVHNREVDAGLILAAAEARLLDRLTE